MTGIEAYIKLDNDKQDKNQEVELTLTEYNALSEAEKHNGKTYYVVNN